MAFVLKRNASFRFGLFNRQFSTKTFRIPAETSLPRVIPPWPSFISQFRTITFSVGAATLRPSRLRPDLMAMQSSPVLKLQLSIRTSVHESGSQPSLFGQWLSIFTFRKVTFVQ